MKQQSSNISCQERLIIGIFLLVTHLFFLLCLSQAKQQRIHTHGSDLSSVSLTLTFHPTSEAHHIKY